MANPNPTVAIPTQIDLRLDIDGSTYNLLSISSESVVLTSLSTAGGTAYKIGYLQERPAVANFAASNAAPAISGLTLVATLASLDGATKFFVDYERAFILLHSSVSTPATIAYSGMGTVVRSLEINSAVASTTLPQDLDTTDTPTFATPTADGHAAIKSYVDSAATSFQQVASTDLTGAIVDSFYLSLAYVLTGDVTIAGDNVFGKIIIGTTDISLTNDSSSRIISGPETVGVDATITFNSVMFN